MLHENKKRPTQEAFKILAMRCQHYKKQFDFENQVQSKSCKSENSNIQASSFEFLNQSLNTISGSKIEEKKTITSYKTIKQSQFSPRKNEQTMNDLPMKTIYSFKLKDFQRKLSTPQRECLPEKTSFKLKRFTLKKQNETSQKQIQQQKVDEQKIVQSKKQTQLQKQIIQKTVFKILQKQREEKNVLSSFEEITFL